MKKHILFTVLGLMALSSAALQADLLGTLKEKAKKLSEDPRIKQAAEQAKQKAAEYQKEFEKKTPQWYVKAKETAQATKETAQETYDRLTRQEALRAQKAGEKVKATAQKVKEETKKRASSLYEAFFGTSQDKK